MSCTREIGYVTRYEEINEDDDYVKKNTFFFIFDMMLFLKKLKLKII